MVCNRSPFWYHASAGDTPPTTTLYPTLTSGSEVKTDPPQKPPGLGGAAL